MEDDRKTSTNLWILQYALVPSNVFEYNSLRITMQTPRGCDLEFSSPCGLSTTRVLYTPMQLGLSVSTCLPPTKIIIRYLYWLVFCNGSVSQNTICENKTIFTAEKMGILIKI